jgi:hypothetical protein
MQAQEHMFRYDSVPKTKLLLALKHNKRELQHEYGASKNIDATKMCLNYFLHSLGDAQQTYNYAMSQIALAGIHSIRKNAVLAIECMFSLPVNWFDKDSKPFFKDCYEWAQQNFAGAILSFDVHLDESAPHAHALFLPLHEGKLQGDKIKGNKASVYARQKLFYEHVGAKYGFKNPALLKLSKEDKKLLAAEVMRNLKSDPVIESKAYLWFRDAVFANPVGCAQLLGISIQPSQPKLKHFVDYARSKGHGSFVK